MLKLTDDPAHEMTELGCALITVGLLALTVPTELVTLLHALLTIT